jgi:hypothetical protein
MEPSLSSNILGIYVITGTAERILDWWANLCVFAGLIFVSPKCSHCEFRLKSNVVDSSAGFRWLRELAFFKLTFVYVIF